LYQAKLFKESSGNPESCSKIYYARGLLQTTYPGAFDDIWQMVHGNKDRDKRLRRKHPKIYSYFAKEFEEVGKSIDLWDEKMRDKETLDPRFQLRLGIAYFEILDGEDHFNDPEYDDKFAVAKYYQGYKPLRENPKKAMKAADRHISNIWKNKKAFGEINSMILDNFENIIDKPLEEIERPFSNRQA
jgi:hypothetical protein